MLTLHPLQSRLHRFAVSKEGGGLLCFVVNKAIHSIVTKNKGSENFVFLKKVFFQKIRKISKIFQIFSFFTFFLVFKKNLFAAVFISFNKLLKVEKLSLKQSVDFIQKSKQLKHYSFLPFRKDKQRKRKNCLYRNFHLSKESEFFIKNFFFPQNFSFFNEKK